MWKHFTRVHVLPGVTFKGLTLLVCLLDCSSQKHYHCPKCGQTYGISTKQRKGIQEHLQECTGESTVHTLSQIKAEMMTNPETEINDEQTKVDVAEMVGDTPDVTAAEPDPECAETDYESSQPQILVEDGREDKVNIHSITATESTMDGCSMAADDHMQLHTVNDCGETYISTVVHPHVSVLQGDDEVVITSSVEAGVTTHDCAVCGTTIRALQVNRHREWHRSSQVVWADCSILGCTLQSCLPGIQQRRSRYHFHFHCPWCVEVLTDRRSALAHYSSNHTDPPAKITRTIKQKSPDQEHSHKQCPAQNHEQLLGDQESGKRSRLSSKGIDMDAKRRRQILVNQGATHEGRNEMTDEVFDAVTVVVNNAALAHLVLTPVDLQEKLQRETGVSCAIHTGGVSLMGMWDQVAEARRLIKALCAADTESTPATNSHCIEMPSSETLSSLKSKSSEPRVMKMNTPTTPHKIPPSNLPKLTKSPTSNNAYSPSLRESRSQKKNNPAKQLGETSRRKKNSKKVGFSETVPHTSSISHANPAKDLGNSAKKKPNVLKNENNIYSSSPLAEKTMDDSSNRVESECKSEKSEEYTGNHTKSRGLVFESVDLTTLDYSIIVEEKYPAESSQESGLEGETDKCDLVVDYNLMSPEAHVEDCDTYITVSNEQNLDEKCSTTVKDDVSLTHNIEGEESNSIPVPISNSHQDSTHTISATVENLVESEINSEDKSKSMVLANSLLEFQTPVPDDVPVLNIIPQLEGAAEQKEAPPQPSEESDPDKNVVSINGVNMELDKALPNKTLLSVMSKKMKPEKMIHIKQEPGTLEQCPACEKMLPLIDLAKHVQTTKSCKDKVRFIDTNMEKNFSIKIQRLIEGFQQIALCRCPSCGVKKQSLAQTVYHFASGFCIDAPKQAKSNAEFCESQGVIRDPISKLYKCCHCPMQTLKPVHLKNHIEAFHLPKVFSCERCPRKFSTQEKQQAHLQVHTNLVECPNCSKMFQETYLQSHIATVHEKVENSVHCKLCDFVTKSSVNLSKHIDNMHSTTGHLCDWCGKHFGQKSTMAKHIQAVHLGIKYKRRSVWRSGSTTCTICGESMLKKNLSTHIRRRHEKLKQFSCDICNAMFTSNNSVKVHKMLHLSEEEKDKMNRYSCQVCGKKFYKKYLYQEHLRAHEKFYDCRHCGKQFRHKQTMIQHQRRPGACPGPDGQAFQSHKCSLCAKTYPTMRRLNNHLSKVHNQMLLQTIETETEATEGEVRLETGEQMTDALGDLITQTLQVSTTPQTIIHTQPVDQILAEVTEGQNGKIIWINSEPTVEFQNELIGTQLVTEQFINEITENIVKTEGESACVYQTDLVSQPVTLMQNPDAVVFETETVELQPGEEFVTIEQPFTDGTELVDDNVQFQCGHCQLLFGCREDINAHVLCSHV